MQEATKNLTIQARLRVPGVDSEVQATLRQSAREKRFDGRSHHAGEIETVRGAHVVRVSDRQHVADDWGADLRAEPRLNIDIGGSDLSRDPFPLAFEVGLVS